jgi:hypothetical protein
MPNKAVATAKARDIYLSLMQSGMEITLRHYKPFLTAPKKLTSHEGTVGDFLAELKEKSDAKPKTLQGCVGNSAPACYHRGHGCQRSCAEHTLREPPEDRL